jgi:hypothetical protein
MGSRDGSLCEVKIQQNNQPLAKEIRGDDVTPRPDGETSLVVDMPRMYELVQNREFGSHLMKLTTSNPHLEIFSFSFTTSVIPELISSN